MLHLRSCILSHFLHSASHLSTLPNSPLFPSLHGARLLLAASPAFVVEDYLVTTCGLTRPQALKASTKLSHLRSPSKPDAVLAFLGGLGLSGANVAAAVARDPQLLCAGVERNLAPKVVDLAGVGLSRSQIAGLVQLTGRYICARSLASKLQYYLGLFGTFENLLRVLKHCCGLLCYDLERVVKPKVELLRECGLPVYEIAKLFIYEPRLISSNLEHLSATVARAKGLGVPVGSPMFKHAVRTLRSHSNETITSKVEHLKDALTWSDAEVRVVLSRYPILLTISDDSLQCVSAFLISEAGLEPAYIAQRPSLPTYSLERRQKPRYYLVKFLKSNGLLDRHPSYKTTVQLTEKAFMDKFIRPHGKAVPNLAEDYSAACRGEMPTRFRIA